MTSNNNASHTFPADLGRQRQELACGLEGPRDAGGFGYAGSFASLGVDDSFSLEQFRERTQLQLVEYQDARVRFELTGVDVSIANAIRRILIAEVATVAIETVHMYQNTGVMQDEVLTHRLGLVPFKIDPEKLEWRKENEDLSEDNSLKLRLHVKCTPADILPDVNHMPLYAKDLKWIPWSKKQHEKFKATPPVPSEPMILLTKLRPGQEIEADLFCEKGIGKTHAKWSPVATAVYRLLPIFRFPKGNISGAEAGELCKLCPMGVFELHDGIAVASNVRNCSTCRACLERFPGRITLTKKKDHFIFTLESAGGVSAKHLFHQAIEVLRDKAMRIRENLSVIVTNAATRRDDAEV